jgi:hypothetical protein
VNSILAKLMAMVITHGINQGKYMMENGQEVSDMDMVSGAIVEEIHISESGKMERP